MMTLALIAALFLSGTPSSQNATLIVLNKQDHTAWLIDPKTGERRKEVRVGVGPHEVAVSPDGKSAVVCNYGEREPGRTLTVLSLPEGQIARTIDTGEHVRPHGAQFLDGDTVAVTSETRQAVLLVNVKSGQVEGTLPTGQAVSHMVALSPDGKTAFTTNIRAGSLSIIDVASAKVLGTVETGAGAEGLEVSPDGRTVWVTNGLADTVSVVDVKAMRRVADLPTGKRPLRAKLTPDGKRALVTCVEGGEIMVVDAASLKPIKTIQTKELKPALDYPPQAPSPLPLGCVVDPEGKEAYIACMAAQQVIVLDLGRLEIVRRLPTGRGPDGMALAILR